MIKKKKLDKTKACPNCKKIEESWKAVLDFKEKMDEKGKWLIKEAPKNYCGIVSNETGEWFKTRYLVVRKESYGFALESNPMEHEYIAQITEYDIPELVDFLKGQYEVFYDKNHKYQLVITKSGVIQLADISGDPITTVKLFEPDQREEAIKMLAELSEK